MALEKGIGFDKEDEQKLLKRISKRESGMVYAHVGEISGFFHITKIPVNELGGITFGEYIKNISDEFERKDKQIEILKQALQDTRNELKTLKGKVELYVV